MLKVLRDNLKYLSWILWVIIALFVAALFLGFDSLGFGGNGGAASSVATIGHDSITREDFERTYKSMERQYRQMYGEQYTPEVAKQLQLPLQALNQAVGQRILLAEAARLGLRASDEEVRDRILTAPMFLDDKGQFVGEAVYNQFLAQERLSPSAFESQIRDDLILNKLFQALKAGVFISDDEVQKAVRDQVEKAKVRYVELAISRLAPGGPEMAAIPAGELNAYYESHKAEYKLPEQREAAYVLVESAKLLPSVQIDDKAIQDYYTSHEKDFSQPEQVHARHILVKIDDQTNDAAAKKKIDDVKRRLDKGEDFAKVAAEVSDDAGSKVKGGDLGLFGRNAMVKEFEDAAFSAPLHKVVGPVKSNFGYHLIEVLEKRPGGQQPLEAVRQTISTRLALERAQTLAEAKAKDLFDRLNKNKPKTPEALNELAKADSTLTYALTGKFGKNDPVPGIGRIPAFNDAAFGLAKGTVSEPVKVGRGWAVLYLQEVLPPRTAALAEVEPRVRVALSTQKQQQTVLDRLQQAKDEMAKGKTLDEVAGALGLQVKESQDFGGNGFIPGLGYSPQIAQTALTLKVGEVGGPVPAGQGAVIYQVVDHKAADPKEMATKGDQIREQLTNERFQKVLGAMVEKRKRDLGVTFNKPFLQSFGIDTPPAG